MRHWGKLFSGMVSGRRMVAGSCLLLMAVPLQAATTRAKAGHGATAEVAAASENAPPAHPVTAAQVYEILSLTGGDTLRREMLDGLVPHVKEMMPYMPADVIEDMERRLGTADYEGAMVRAFRQRLSTEDAAAIIAFYQSNAGQHLVAVLPNVMDTGREAAAELGQQVMVEVMRRHKDEIDAAAKVYRAQHPESASSR
jgi:uncharacterized protein